MNQRKKTLTPKVADIAKYFIALSRYMLYINSAHHKLKALPLIQAVNESEAMLE